VWERGEDGENVDSWATMVQYEVQQPGMGLLRLVGSLKLQVSFAKEPSKRDHILQKKPIILRSLLSIATSYSISALFNSTPYLALRTLFM